MEDIQNAINSLEITLIRHGSEGLIEDVFSANTLKTAIEALEKQIAKKPSLVGMQNKCPNIDCLESVLRYYNYCSECGQKIDWNKD